MIRLIGIAPLMLLLCVPAAAQTQKFYVSAGVGRHAEAGPSGTTLWVADPAWPGGAVNSLVVGGGVALNAIVSIDGELALTSSMHARQPSRYFTVIWDRREVMMSGGVRFHKRVATSVHLEHVAGVLFVTDRGWQQMEYDPPVSPGHVVGERSSLSPNRRVGVSAGVDVRIGANRVAVVPSVHLLHLFGDYVGGSAKVWTWTARPGVALRIYF